jgi:hypothetical protein
MKQRPPSPPPPAGTDKKIDRQTESINLLLLFALKVIISGSLNKILGANCKQAEKINQELRDKNQSESVVESTHSRSCDKKYYNDDI